MDADVEGILEFALNIPNITYSDALVLNFRELVESLGFRHFVMTGLPWSGTQFCDLVAAHNFPDDWGRHYVESAYLKDDAIALAALTSVAPYTWQNAIKVFARTERAHRIADEARAYGLVDGVSFPYLDIHNRLALASMVCDHPVDIAAHLVAVLQAVMPLVYNRFWSIAELGPSAVGRLTPKEIDLLRLVSAGKSLQQVAGFWRKEEATVRLCFQNAHQKLAGVPLPPMVVAAINRGAY